MDVPATMRQIGYQLPGGPDVMAPVMAPVPEPRPDEVLIRVAAAGVNRPDVSQRQGSYPPPPKASPVLGLEVAGEVVACGADVTEFSPGERVCALTNGGGYAQYAVAPAAQTLPWPAGYDAVRAAALPENFFTVWANLFELGRLARGESLLVHGGTSGIGITAIQLAREFGAHAVFATVGNTAKARAVEALGATAINYREADFQEEIRKATGGKGVNVVLDMVGAPYFARNVASLALEGRLVLIAFLGGAKLDTFDLRPIMVRRLTVCGSTMRPRTTEQKGAIAAALREKVWPALSAGRCAPVIHRVFKLEEAPQAHALMEASAHIGKIVLDVGL